MNIPFWVWFPTMIIGGFSAIVLLCYIIVAPLQYIGCKNAWNESGREWRWTAKAGCQIHDGKGWVPAHQVRVP